MLGGWSPFQDMFKMSAYRKWYHYFWFMPLLLIYLITTMAITKVMAPIWWLLDKVEDVRPRRD